jgi:hypothetical protein
MQSPRKATMQEKVASAAEAIERNARQVRFEKDCRGRGSPDQAVSLWGFLPKASYAAPSGHCQSANALAHCLDEAGGRARWVSRVLAIPCKC